MGSNRVKKVRTPGGKLVFQYLKKRPSVPKCPMTGLRLKGVRPATNQEKTRLSKRLKTVNRSYGGVLSHKAVREKIVRLPDRGAEDCYEGPQGPGRKSLIVSLS